MPFFNCVPCLCLYHKFPQANEELNKMISKKASSLKLLAIKVSDLYLMHIPQKTPILVTISGSLRNCTLELKRSCMDENILLQQDSSVRITQVSVLSERQE